MLLSNLVEYLLASIHALHGEAKARDACEWQELVCKGVQRVAQGRDQLRAVESNHSDRDYACAQKLHVRAFSTCLASALADTTCSHSPVRCADPLPDAMLQETSAASRFIYLLFRTRITGYRHHTIPQHSITASLQRVRDRRHYIELGSGPFHPSQHLCVQIKSSRRCTRIE